MEFTGQMAKDVSELSVKTLNEIFSEKGYKITVTNAGGKYAPFEFTLKLKLALSNGDGETQAKADYRRYAAAFGLPLEMLGSTLNYNGKFYTVTGLLPRRPKNNIQITTASGKTFIAPHDKVVREYERATATFEKTGVALEKIKT